MKSRKICIVGNSHIGSLKRGWHHLKPEHGDKFSITFFGHRANRLEHLEPDGTALVPTNDDLRESLIFTSEGKDRIVPEHYDTTLLYGMSAQAWLLPINFTYSSAALTRAAFDLVDGRLSMVTLQKIRSIYDGTIEIGHDPLPAMEKLDEESSSNYENGINQLNKIIYSKLNSNICCQPIESIVNGKNTESSYSAGSRRLAVNEKLGDEHHNQDDRVHMNDKFGLIWLRTFLSNLSD